MTSFLGVEHRIEGRDEGAVSTKTPRKIGDLLPTWRESQTKMQALRITDTHRAEFLLQSTVTWEQLLAKKKERFLDGHFETIPDFDVHTFLPYLLVLNPQACASPHEQREVWLSGQVRPQHRLRAQRVRQDHFCGQ